MPDSHELERIRNRAGIIAQSNHSWKILPIHLLAGCLRIPSVIEMLRDGAGVDSDDAWRTVDRVIAGLPREANRPTGTCLNGECLQILTAAAAMGEQSAVNVMLAIANHDSLAGEMLREQLGIKPNDWKRAA